MENITLGEIGVALTFIVGILSSIAYLKKHLKEWVVNALSDQLTQIDVKINDLDRSIKTVDVEACKNYLVSVLSSVERGNELDDIEQERFWEEYEHYIKKGGNSYIKRKVEQLKKDEKI